jgi:hypothetical protein
VLSSKTTINVADKALVRPATMFCKYVADEKGLQLSVVESAPYDYSGDDLFAINKRCSNLALQVIANLQVKSKLDKELTFEFILPSGDELISGVMCNLQCTMKQGSCIGAPSYVEVIVQPIKKESITSNGKHVITPSKGYDAMREVEVDVEIEMKADPILQEKNITITENGMIDVVADNGFDALGKVNITTDVPTIDGFDVEKYGMSKDFQDRFNRMLESDIAYTIEEMNKNKNKESLGYAFQGNGRILFLPFQLKATNFDSTFYVSGLKTLDNFIFENAVVLTNAFYGCTLEYLPEYINLKQCTSCTNAFGLTTFRTTKERVVIDFGSNGQQISCLNFMNAMQLKCNVLKEFRFVGNRINNLQRALFNVIIDNVIDDFYYEDSENVTTMNNFINGNTKFRRMALGDVSKCTNFVNAFNHYLLEGLFLKKWKSANIVVANSNVFFADCVKYIIFHAMSIEDGATSRTLDLHATPLATWNNEVANTTPTADDAEFLEVEDWDRYKKEDGTLYTWSEIASKIKDITIA